MLKTTSLAAVAVALATSFGAFAAQAENHAGRDLPAATSAISNAVSVSASTDAGTSAQAYIAAPHSHGGPSGF